MSLVHYSDSSSSEGEDNEEQQQQQSTATTTTIENGGKVLAAPKPAKISSLLAYYEDDEEEEEEGEHRQDDTKKKKKEKENEKAKNGIEATGTTATKTTTTTTTGTAKVSKPPDKLDLTGVILKSKSSTPLTGQSSTPFTPTSNVSDSIMDETEAKKELQSAADSAFQSLSFIELPPETPGPCDPTLQAKISQMLVKCVHKPFNAQLLALKKFRNPKIYTMLIDTCEIKEFGTNFPNKQFSIYDLPEEGFYDNISKKQKEFMEKKQLEMKERKEISFAPSSRPLTPTIPAATGGLNTSEALAIAIQRASKIVAENASKRSPLLTRVSSSSSTTTTTTTTTRVSKWDRVDPVQPPQTKRHKS